MDTFADKRRRMVETQFVGRGVVEQAVLDAMPAVPREVFVPGPAAEFAYEDTPLPIDEGQTISQPYVVALIAVALKLGDGTLGWREHAPYDPSVIAAGAPSVPDALREQLVIGGWLVIPVGRTARAAARARDANGSARVPAGRSSSGAIPPHECEEMPHKGRTVGE